MTIQEQVEQREARVQAVTEGLRLHADKERIIRDGTIQITADSIRIGGLAAQFGDILEGKVPGKQDKRARCARCKAIMVKQEDDSLACPKGCLPLTCWSCGSADLDGQRCNHCGETQSLLRGVKPIWEDQPVAGIADYQPSREDCHKAARETLQAARETCPRVPVADRQRVIDGQVCKVDNLASVRGLLDSAKVLHCKHLSKPLTEEDREEADRLYAMLRRHTGNQIADGKRIGQKIKINGGKQEAIVAVAGVQASGLDGIQSGRLAKKEKVHYSKHESKLHLANDAWKEELPTFGLLAILDRSQKTDSPLGKVVTKDGKEVNQSIKTSEGDSRLLIDWFRAESVQSGGPSKGRSTNVQCPSGMDIDTFLEYCHGKSAVYTERDHKNIESLPPAVDFDKVLKQVKAIMPKQFQAWTASKVKGCPQEEIAARQGVTQGAVAKRIAQADKAIKAGISSLIAGSREELEVKVMYPSLPQTVSKVPGKASARQKKQQADLAERQAQADLAEDQRKARQAIASQAADRKRFRFWESLQEVKING